MKPAVEENPEYFLWPRFALGEDLDLNDQLNQHSIAPSKNAYRNLYLKGLLQRIPKLGNEKKRLEKPFDEYLFTEEALKDVFNGNLNFSSSFKR